eukprot:m51a1_g10374 hypothetical protein (311) ;mRNA; f:102825-104486
MAPTETPPGQWSATDTAWFACVGATHAVLLAFSVWRVALLLRYRNSALKLVLRCVEEGVYAGSPCLLEHDRPFDMFCDGVYSSTSTLASLLFFLCYLTTILNWGEFVHLVETQGRGNFFRKARVPVALVVAALVAFFSSYLGMLYLWRVSDFGSRAVLQKLRAIFLSSLYMCGSLSLGWFGIRVAVQLRYAVRRPPAKLVWRILATVSACSLLLILRAVWNLLQLFWPAVDFDRGFLDWRYALYMFLCEITPTLLMLVVMTPSPGPQESEEFSPESSHSRPLLSSGSSGFVYISNRSGSRPLPRPDPTPE